jgi:hypothetical protein
MIGPGVLAVYDIGLGRSVAGIAGCIPARGIDVCRVYQTFWNWGTLPHWGGALILWGAWFDCIRGIFILNEIWAQSKNIYFDSHFAWLKYFTYHLVSVLDPNYKQYILSPARVRKICYLLAELCVRSVCLNLFGWSGAWCLWNILKGGHKF